MLRVGLTGGIGSGKTFVGRALEDLGGHLIQADELGHQVLQPGGEAYAPVLAEFGASILAGGGEIDRRALAALVFESPERLQRLNALIHPAVMRLEEERIAALARTDPDSIAIVEAAILIETGSYKRFDKLIVVICQPEQQIERAVKRGGMTREEAESRIRRQLSNEEKMSVADYVIDTSGSKERTLEEAKSVFESLRSAMG
jgi:dephospho-CoA kinase